MLERKDLVQDTASSTGTGAFSMAGSPPVGLRPFSIHANGATFDYRAFAGSDWEIGVGTWNGSAISRAPVASSNGNALVNFSTPPVVMEVVSAASVASFLTAADGTDVSTLTASGTFADDDKVLVLKAGGTLATILGSIIKAASTGTGTTQGTTATGVTMTGPTTGVVSAASNNFTVGVTPVGGTITGTVVVTPSDNGGGGSFSPTTVSLTSASPTATFTYTPSATAGARTISVTNSASLSNPANITYTSTSAAVPATAITMTGPTSGTVSVASTNFTVALSPNGGTVTGTVTVTPSDSAAGGTFSPTTVSLTTAAPSATFTYTPNATAASKTISITNNGSLSNPANITYVANAAGTMAQTYNLTTGVSFPTTGAFSGGTAPNQYFSNNFNIYVKDASQNAPAANALKFCWGKAADTPPIAWTGSAWPTAVPFTANGGNTGNVPGSVQGSIYTNSGSFPGLFSPASSLFGGGSAGNFFLWVLFSDGSSKAFGTAVAVA